MPIGRRRGMRCMELGDPGTRLRKELVASVLRGDKTATVGLLGEYERDGDALPVVGERFVLLDADDEEVGVVETVEVRVMRVGDCDLALAQDEGEGFASVAEWRAAHERYWSSYWPEPIDDDTRMVAERFVLVERKGS